MSAPVAIAHVIHRLDVGGLENGLVNLIDRLPQERFRHLIVCLAGFNPEFRARIRNGEVPVESLEKRPGKDPRAYLRFWRLLRRYRPAIVHTRNLGTIDLQWIAAVAGVRHRVHGEHGWEAADPRGLSPRSLAIRRACRPVVGRYVALSKDIANWLEQDVRVARSRIRHICNGVDTDRFRPEGPAVRDRPWADAERPIVIGTAGRLDPVKDLALLLRAMRLIQDTDASHGRNVRLLIAGEGPLRKNLESLAGELGLAGQTWFAGVRKDMPELMRSIDVFVLTSVGEGISNTILEAMASGRPVVATRVGGNPELVADGENGRLCDSGDVEGVAAAIRSYLESPEQRASHGQSGRRRAVECFSLDAMVAGYANLYDELLRPVKAVG